MNTQSFVDPKELIALSRAGIETTMRFYLNLNENIMRMSSIQRDAINESNKKAIEMVNTSFDEFVKQNRIINGRIEENVKSLLEKSVPTTERSAEA